jgi:hypothetical protein
VTAAHRNVPVGTVLDIEGTPVTIRRDYDSLVLPGCSIPLEQWEALLAIIIAAGDAMASCRAEMAGEDDD